MRRVDALEAGIRFMTWVFSEGFAFTDDVHGFTTQVGMSWGEVEESLKKDGGTLRLIREIEQKSSHLGRQVFAWFEVGRNTIFLSNMVGTGAPSSLVDVAMSGYRRYLEDAQIRVEERNRLQSLLSSMQTASMEEKTIALGHLRERLGDQAMKQDETELVRPQEANNPWVLGSFYLFVVVVVGASLLATAKILPLIALPIIVIGSIVALSIIGALQLRNDGRLRDEPFLKLMALSFKYLPLPRRRE
jgi:hypothetical protein